MGAVLCLVFRKDQRCLVLLAGSCESAVAVQDTERLRVEQNELHPRNQKPLRAYTATNYCVRLVRNFRPAKSVACRRLASIWERVLPPMKFPEQSDTITLRLHPEPSSSFSSINLLPEQTCHSRGMSATSLRQHLLLSRRLHLAAYMIRMP